MYILKGHIDIKIENKKINLKESEGIVLAHNAKINEITNSDSSEILEVTSKKKKIYWKYW